VFASNQEPLLITNAHLVDPARNLEGPGFLLARDGKVEGCEPGAAPSVEGATVVDAEGLTLAPGLWDVHVHFREPGQEDKETIATGCLAAAAGGFTDVVTMPNTTPPIHDAASIHLVRNKAAQSGKCRVHPSGAITMGLGGDTMCEYGDMVDAGAVAFTDDGRPVADGGLMRRAMEYTRMLGVPMVTHAEDLTLSRGGAMHEGQWSTRLGIRGIPYAAEVSCIARDIELARLSRAHLHVAHVSSAAGVELVRRAKADGLRVTAETAPHFLDFTDADCATYETRFKMNPPLRTMEDQVALVEGLADGTLDCIATDLAPHTATEKERPFGEAPFGVVGVETAFAASHDRLVRRGGMPLLRLLELMSTAPARIMGLPGGSLAPGQSADFTLIDLEQTWVPAERNLQGRSKNCPWLGRNLTGRVMATYLQGVPTWNRMRSQAQATA